MRRVVFRLLSAACVVAAVPIVLGSSARADQPDQYGWWWEANQAPLNTLLAPPAPTAPKDGLFLANAPNGPMAVAALHVNVDNGGAATLTLHAASGGSFGSATPTVACPAGSWAPAQAGDWSNKPTADCGAVGGGVAGEPATDGSTMTWKLDERFQPQPAAYNVVLVPKGDLFWQVPIAKPDANTLVVTEPSAEASPASPPVSDLGSAAASPSVDVGSTPSLSLSSPSVALPGPSPAASPAPQVARRPAAAPRQAQVRLPPPVKAADARGQRIMAVALLGALGIAFWWLGGRPVRAPRSLGALRTGRGEEAPATTASAARVGGIGRFARPRVAAPTRL